MSPTQRVTTSLATTSDGVSHYQVVWPRFRADYLNVEAGPMSADDPRVAAVSPLDQPTDARPPAALAPDPEVAWVEVGRPSPAAHPEPLDPAALRARAVAIAAFIQGAGCSQQRVAEVFGLSRRTIGRTALRGPVHDAGCRDDARLMVVSTIERESTDEERTAALAWLEDMTDDAENQDAVIAASTLRIPAERRVGELLAEQAALQQRAGRGRPNNVPVGNIIQPPPTLPDQGLTAEESHTYQRIAAVPEPQFEPDTLDTLQQLHQRIRRRAIVVSALFEMHGQDAMGEAMKELVDDVIAITGSLEDVLRPLRVE